MSEDRYPISERIAELKAEVAVLREALERLYEARLPRHSRPEEEQCWKDACDNARTVLNRK